MFASILTNYATHGVYYREPVPYCNTAMESEDEENCCYNVRVSCCWGMGNLGYVGMGLFFIVITYRFLFTTIDQRSICLILLFLFFQWSWNRLPELMDDTCNNSVLICVDCVANFAASLHDYKLTLGLLWLYIIITGWTYEHPFFFPVSTTTYC